MMGAWGTNPDYVIARCKKRATEAFEAKEGIDFLSPLEKAFYLRFQELEACKKRKEKNRSTFARDHRQKIEDRLSSLSAKIGKLHTRSPIIWSRQTALDL